MRAAGPAALSLISVCSRLTAGRLGLEPSVALVKERAQLHVDLLIRLVDVVLDLKLHQLARARRALDAGHPGTTRNCGAR